MTSHFFKDAIFVGITILMSMMLTVFPLPSWLMWFRPEWLLMTLLFWSMMMPHRVGVGALFFVGLLADLLTGTLFGQHALVLTIIGYICLRFQNQLRSLPLWQQFLAMFSITFSYLAIQYVVMQIGNVATFSWKYWMPVVTTAIVWPWINALLKNYQYRLKLA